MNSSSQLAESEKSMPHPIETVLQPVVLRSSTLEVHFAPHVGGAISHLIPCEAGSNQLRWSPPSQGIGSLTRYVPVGGWQDIPVWQGSGFPGVHWNRAFEIERQETGSGTIVTMSLAVDGVELTRRVSLDPDRAAVTVTTDCVNHTGGSIKEFRLQSHPILTPGGTRNLKAAVLLPASEGVETHVLTVAGVQPKRVGSVQREPTSNWWACSDPDANVTLLIEDPSGCTAVQCLHQDPDLLILHNFTPTGDLPAGETVSLGLTLRYYPLDLTPLVQDLGASRFVPEADMLIGLNLCEREFAPDETPETSVRLSCVDLGQASSAKSGYLRIEDSDGRQVFEKVIRFSADDQSCLATVTVPVSIGKLPLGSYHAVFAVDDYSAEVGSDFSVVNETSRQRHEAGKRRLASRLAELAGRVGGLDADGLVVGLMRQDLATATALLGQSVLDRAERHAGWVEDALEKLSPSAVAPASPWESELSVSKRWLDAIESGIPEIPPVRQTADHYGSCQLGAFNHGWNFSNDACAAYVLSLLYFHPQSRYHGNVAVLCRAICLVDHLCGAFVAGSLPREIARDRNINRFTLGPLGEAIRILLELPLNPERKDFWKDQYRQAADFQIQEYGGAKIPEGGYLNQDVMYLLVMRFAHYLTDDSRYTGEADAILRMIESQLLPDGAFYYKYPHNEVTGYHDINVAYLYRDWQLSGDDRGRDMVARTQPYYPLMVSAGGWVEISTQTWWKHVTGARWPFIGPAVVAGVTGDAHNQYVAKARPIPKQTGVGGIERLIYAAQAARDDLKTEPPPDQYLIYDRNVDGPRGRFGPFSWAGTTAPYRDTLVGALFSEADDDWAYAMHYAGPQVIYSKTNQTNSYRGGAGLTMSPAQYERNVVIRDTHAVLWARYDLYQVEQTLPGNATSDWVAEQLWYFDRERLIGLLSLTPKRPTTAHAVDLSVRFAHYDSERAHPQIELIGQGDGNYRSGPFALRVVEHNMEALKIEETWVCNFDEDLSGKGCFARSTPADGGFHPGQTHRLLVEVRLNGSAPAVIEFSGDSSKGFRLVLPEGEVRVVGCG